MDLLCPRRRDQPADPRSAGQCEQCPLVCIEDARGRARPSKAPQIIKVEGIVPSAGELFDRRRGVRCDLAPTRGWHRCSSSFSWPRKLAQAGCRGRARSALPVPPKLPGRSRKRAGGIFAPRRGTSGWRPFLPSAKPRTNSCGTLSGAGNPQARRKYTNTGPAFSEPPNELNLSSNLTSRNNEAAWPRGAALSEFTWSRLCATDLK